MGRYTLLTTREGSETTGGKIKTREIQRRARLDDFPPGVVVRLGRKIFLSEEKWLAFLEAGGQPLKGPGGWKRPPVPRPDVPEQAAGGA